MAHTNHAPAANEQLAVHCRGRIDALGDLRSGQRSQPGGSFDTIAGSLRNMFDFDRSFEEAPRKVILNETSGVVVSVSGDRDDDDRDDRH